MSSCHFHMKRPMQNGEFINWCGNPEVNENKSNLNGHDQQDIACEKDQNGEEIKNSSGKNHCNQCLSETNTKNMCDHQNQDESCKYHSKHRRNSESNFNDGFTNIRCKFCWYINRIHNSEIKEVQNSFQTHIKCVYCLSNVSIKNLIPKNGISHPYCRKCQINANGREGPFPHTDCKYCQSGKKVSHEQKHNVPHTACKYCHDMNYESTDSSFEECEDPYAKPYYLQAPCSVHDIPYRYSRHLSQHGKLFPSRNNSYLHEHPPMHLIEDSPDTDYLRDALRNINLSSTIHMNDCINGDGMNRSMRFRPCEYCFKNGESAVIYNSHQFQNASGVVTCPLVRQYETIRDSHYCPHDNGDFRMMHSYTDDCMHNLLHFHKRKANGSRGYRYSF